MRSRAILPVAALLAASAWCVVLLLVRKVEYGAAFHAYLVWNLALAWIPLLLTIPIALVVANLVATIPAWLATRTRPAVALRAE